MTALTEVAPGSVVIEGIHDYLEENDAIHLEGPAL